MTPNKPILVTGPHRSGSTWVGRVLSSAPSICYIHEPFNRGQAISPVSKPFENWFQYISHNNEEDYFHILSDVLEFRFPVTVNLMRARNLRNVARIGIEWISSMNSRLKKARPLMKDPIAFFSAEWLHRTFDMDVVLLMRHPAAFCSSLKIKKWNFDFNNFLRQPELMNGYLERFKRTIELFSCEPRPIIEQGILLWNCFANTTKLYLAAHKEWIFIRHEDISLSPEESFNDLFKLLKLNFTNKVREKIAESSGPQNPVEQDNRREFNRNSKRNIDNWKHRLTREEIDIIRKGTKEFYTDYYSENDW